MTPYKVGNRLHVAQPCARRPNSGAAIEYQPLPGRGYGVDSVTGGLSHNVLTLFSHTSQISFLIFMMGNKGFGVDMWSVTNLPPRSYTTAIEVEVSCCGEESPRLGGQNSTSERIMSLGS